jgi:two-component system chemotaxis response regulator CheB
MTPEQFAKMKHDIVVIGASAGGLEPLRTILAALPADLPATLFVVLHSSPHFPGYLADILDRSGKLHASFAKDGQWFEKGKVYVAPADFHLLVEGEKLRVFRGPKENLHRPAIDPLFRSAAVYCGPRVVGIILSGMQNDGVAGLQTVRQCGGKVIVQDPKEALFRSMPENALQNESADFCLPSSAIAEVIQKLATTAADTVQSPKNLHLLKAEAAISGGQTKDEQLLDQIGKRSTFTCPECSGTLWEIEEGKLLRFRCHIGHAYTSEYLSQDQNDSIQKALSVAVRTLDDQASLTKTLAEHSAQQGREMSRRIFEERHNQALAHANVLREILASDGAPMVSNE